jgi:hypothetical protein
VPISSSGRASPSVDPTCLLTAQRAGWGTRRYGLIQEMNGRVMSAFSKEDNAEAKRAGRDGGVEDGVRRAAHRLLGRLPSHHHTGAPGAPYILRVEPAR